MAMQKEQRERNAAIAIQQGYRRYLRRMYGSALCDMFLANKYLKYLAAMKIIAVARGRLGRRIANTERALLTIKKSHPLLIRHSLRTSLRGPKVFWYKRQIEIDMLYANYLELVKKTGFIPPRKLVEANIIEIARRIIARQSQLIVLVQRRWRGFMARRIVRYFRTEISRLFQFRVARVMKIQRVYRGHAVRLSIPALIREWERKETMEDYLRTSKDASMYGSKFKIADQVMGFYQVERSEEKSARYTSRVASAHHYDMKKMHAFWDSPYADKRLTLQTDRLLNIEYGLIKREKDTIHAEHDRKIFMEQRIHERGPTGFGLRSIATVMPPSSYYYDAVLTPEELGEDERASTGINLSSNMLASVAVGGDTINSIVSSRSKSFRIYFQGEIHHLAELIVERMQHDFSKKGISKRFKAHNDERLKRLETRLRIEQRAERALANAGVHESPLKAKLRRSSITNGAASNAHLNTAPSSAHLNAAPSSSHMDVSHIPAHLGRETSVSAAPRFGTTDGKRKGSTLGIGGVGGGDHISGTDDGIAGVGGGRPLSHSVSTLALPDIKNGKLVKPSKKVDKYLRGNFKYPEHIYFNSMEWLYQDYDVKTD